MAAVISGPYRDKISPARVGKPRWKVTLKAGHRVVTETFFDEAQADKRARALRRRFKGATS